MFNNLLNSAIEILQQIIFHKTETDFFKKYDCLRMGPLCSQSDRTVEIYGKIIYFLNKIIN